MITAYGSVSDAVVAMKAGAFDYIQKPFELEALLLLAQRALEASLMKEEIQYLRQQTTPVAHWSERLVGQSPAIMEIKKLIPVVAATKSTILLQGETGTGKEVIAEAIHQASGECASTPDQGQLSGHPQGPSGE